MSTFSQNPDPNIEFDDLTAGLAYVTPWQTMFDAAEEHLRQTQPEGFDVEDIGRLAWQSLPEAERAEALDCLFYTYWAARESDREQLARHEQGGAR